MNDMVSDTFNKANLSKAVLAKKMGVSRAYITQILSGKKNITLKTLSDLCKCCGMEFDIKVRKIKKPVESTSIPASHQWLFWDADFSQLDPVLHRKYILLRILTRGDEEAVKWMMLTYPRRQIIQCIRRNLRQLDARSLNFWALIFQKEDEWLRILAAPNAISWQR